MTRHKHPGLSAGEAVLQHIMNTCVGASQALGRAREGNWLAAGPIQPGIRKRYDKGIFFVGNIAGEAHPYRRRHQYGDAISMGAFTNFNRTAS